MSKDIFVTLDVEGGISASAEPGVLQGPQGDKWMKAMTQSEYDGLAEVDPEIYYIVTPDEVG
ncbi:MAG: hypothetical protein WC292_00395 [Clostridia bacterium]